VLPLAWKYPSETSSNSIIHLLLMVLPRPSPAVVLYIHNMQSIFIIPPIIARSFHQFKPATPFHLSNLASTTVAMAGPTQPYCISCNINFTDMSSHARHFKTSGHMKAESKTVVGVPLDKFRGGSAKELNPKAICRVCCLAFPAKRVLTSHVKQSTLHRERCSCKVCDEVFVDRQALKFHYK